MQKNSIGNITNKHLNRVVMAILPIVIASILSGCGSGFIDMIQPFKKDLLILALFGDSGTIPDMAELISLSISPGSFSPSFQPDTEMYEALYLYPTSSVTFVPVSPNPGSSISITGPHSSSNCPSGYESDPVELTPGFNAIMITVTSESGTHHKTYTVTIYRAPAVYQTGQTISYHSGDDGDLRKGEPWPNPRFTSAGGEILNDRMLGVQWYVGSSPVLPWLESLAFIQSSSEGGNTDWRMPNCREMWSLISYGEVRPDLWLVSNGFTGLRELETYWTSTSYSDDPDDFAWYYSFGDSIVGNGLKNDPHPFLFVRLHDMGVQRTGQSVSYASHDDGDYREGVPWPSPRFILNEDTVFDNMTGLEWVRDGYLMPSTGFPENDDISNDGFVFWDTSFDFVSFLNGQNHGGYSDWRIPNIRELGTLINHDAPHPAKWLNDEGFENIIFTGYWTSTTDPADADRAFVISFHFGNIWKIHKAGSSFCVLPVRGGY